MRESRMISRMKTVDQTLLRLGIACWLCFAVLMAVDIGALSPNLRGPGLLFRWQAWLLAGICVIALRDLTGVLPGGRKNDVILDEQPA